MQIRIPSKGKIALVKLTKGVGSNVIVILTILPGITRKIIHVHVFKSEALLLPVRK